MATKTLNAKRNSSAMQEFKNQVITLLEFANNREIEYHIVRDLAKKINLPFYKETCGKGIRNKMSSEAVVKEYCKLCIAYYKQHPDDAFIEEFFMHLSEQQDQHLRKLSRRTAI